MNSNSKIQSKITKGIRITIRINIEDLNVIKKKAAQNGLPYQTLIATILHHYATDKLKIEL